MPPAPMLDVAVQHHFPGFALDAAFTAPASGVTALFGPSGCGKSTILAAVSGLLRPDAGHVVLNGQALFDSSQGRMVPPERRRCGVVFQDSRLFPHLSVETNLRYGLRRAPAAVQGNGAEGPEMEEIIELLGIGHLLGRRPAALSGGEKQRVALGRALLSRPNLLLMDEPLAALDTARKAEVLPFLFRLRERLSIPILYVTHALDEVDRLADTLVLMEAGRILAHGPVEALAARTDLPLLATRRDIGAVLACTVQAHDPERGLSRLGFAGGTLLVPLAAASPGTRVRVRVRARDVSVATTQPHDISVQNILPAIVEKVEHGQPHEAMLHLRVGESLLLSRITRDAVTRLGLRPGAAVWALVKSVAFSPSGGPAT
jgi:molybdate transport system ATP-binding protein